VVHFQLSYLTPMVKHLEKLAVRLVLLLAAIEDVAGLMPQLQDMPFE
jgi:hypothetical protein